MVERRIAARPDRVWQLITDIEASPQLVSGIDEVVVLDGDGFGPGLRWRETRTMFGRQASEEMWISEVDVDARRYRVEADNGGTHYVTDIDVRDDGDGAMLRQTFGATTDGVVGRVLAATVGRAFVGATRKAIERDLADIAAVAEAD